MNGEAIQSAAPLGLFSCRTCGRVSQLAHAVVEGTPLHCPRCDTALNHRLPASLQRTWAYTLAATILYIPANLLPIMSTSSVFGDTQHTILGGIEELRASGDWLLALIVFVASIAVPLLKVGALLLLATTAQRRSRWKQLERAQIYRMIDAVGHWTMLDVYVVVLLVGTLSFGALGSVQPGPGLLSFGAVVVLTMMAAGSFDPRLIWPEETETPPTDD
ncbi:MAG: paraquat-inducible protein A [Rhizobacter sp.]|nr:paraquat-inducible protein A [Rhizobacter sp.]